MKTIALIVLRLACSSFVLWFMFYLYGVMPDNDWKPNLEKFYAYFAFFLVIAAFEYIGFRRKSPRAALWAEAAMLLIILGGIFYTYSPKWVPNGFQRPVADYGFMVIDAARMVLVDHQNPYSSQTISPIVDIFPPEYRGFYYGPLMIVGYAPSLYSNEAYKYMSVIFALVSAILLGFLVFERGDPLPQRVAAILFVEAAYFMPERMWIELFSRGAHDYFPVMLILAALLALKKDADFLTGLFAGLSFAAKFSPAVFLFPLLPIRKKNFWIGLLLGCTPFLPFILWDLPGLARNVFIVRFIMPHDGSSLRWTLAPEYHWMLPAAAILAMGFAFFQNLRKPLKYRTVLFGFALVMIVGETTFKQVHLNHLNWFFPLFALLFTYNRERLFGLLSSPFQNEPETA